MIDLARTDLGMFGETVDELQVRMLEVLSRFDKVAEDVPDGVEPMLAPGVVTPKMLESELRAAGLRGFRVEVNGGYIEIVPSREPGAGE